MMKVSVPNLLHKKSNMLNPNKLFDNESVEKLVIFEKLAIWNIFSQIAYF